MRAFVNIRAQSFRKRHRSTEIEYPPRNPLLISSFKLVSPPLVVGKTATRASLCPFPSPPPSSPLVDYTAATINAALMSRPGKKFRDIHLPVHGNIVQLSRKRKSLSLLYTRNKENLFGHIRFAKRKYKYFCVCLSVCLSKGLIGWFDRLS